MAFAAFALLYFLMKDPRAGRPANYGDRWLHPVRGHSRARIRRVSACPSLMFVRSLRRLLGTEQILHFLKGTVMSALDDLNAAEAANEAQVAAVVQEVHDLVAQLGQTPPDNTDAINAITARINASTAALAALAITPAP